MNRKVLLGLLAVCAGAVLGGVEIPLKNPGFLEENGRISGWHRCSRIEAGATVSTEVFQQEPRRNALVLASAPVANWLGMEQSGISLAALPPCGPEQQYRFVLNYKQKNEHVTDGGFVTFCFFSRQGKVVAYRDSPKTPAVFDWRDQHFSVKFAAIPADAVALGIRFFLGKTSGKMYIAQPELRVEVVPK